MTTPSRNVTVTLIHTPRPLLSLRRRHQPWRWVAKSVNGKTLATSGESYTNKADCIGALWLLFGPAVSVELVTDDGGFVLRSADGEAEW